MRVMKPERLYEEDIRDIVARIHARRRERNLRRASVVVAMGLLVTAMVMWRLGL